MLSINLTSDEFRVILSSLSMSIIQLRRAGEMVSSGEQIEVYKRLHAIADKMFPGWLITNDELRVIIYGLMTEELPTEDYPIEDGLAGSESAKFNAWVNPMGLDHSQVSALSPFYKWAYGIYLYPVKGVSLCTKLQLKIRIKLLVVVCL